MKPIIDVTPGAELQVAPRDTDLDALIAAARAVEGMTTAHVQRVIEARVATQVAIEEALQAEARERADAAEHLIRMRKLEYEERKKHGPAPAAETPEQARKRRQEAAAKGYTS